MSEALHQGGPAAGIIFVCFAFVVSIARLLEVGTLAQTDRYSLFKLMCLGAMISLIMGLAFGLFTAHLAQAGERQTSSTATVGNNPINIAAPQNSGTVIGAISGPITIRQGGKTGNPLLDVAAEGAAKQGSYRIDQTDAWLYLYAPSGSKFARDPTSEIVVWRGDQKLLHYKMDLEEENTSRDGHLWESDISDKFGQEPPCLKVHFTVATDSTCYRKPFSSLKGIDRVTVSHLALGSPNVVSQVLIGMQRPPYGDFQIAGPFQTTGQMIPLGTSKLAGIVATYPISKMATVDIERND